MKFKFFRSASFKWLLASTLIFGPFVLVPKWNDWQLACLQNEISVMKHPGNSKFVARHGEILNFGNGNHNDFWAIELRELAATQKQTVLKQRYEGKRLPVPNDDYEQEIPDGTQELSWQLLPSPLPKNYLFKQNNGEWNLAHFAGKRDLYIVQIANIGENYAWDTFFDWRGS